MKYVWHIICIISYDYIESKPETLKFLCLHCNKNISTSNNNLRSSFFHALMIIKTCFSLRCFTRRINIYYKVLAIKRDNSILRHFMTFKYTGWSWGFSQFVIRCNMTYFEAMLSLCDEQLE